MNSKITKNVLFFTLILLLILGQPVSAATQANQSNLDQYAQYFYNRYSKNFDDYGLEYSVPSYGIERFSPAKTAREFIALASYYKYKIISNDEQAEIIIKKAIHNAIAEISGRPTITQSFNDAEAFFLIARMMTANPALLNSTETETILKTIAEYEKDGILAKDTENRAMISGAHWQYLNNFLLSKNKITETKKKEFDLLIKKKIDSAIKESIKDGWYKENKFKDFSVHYQAVSAFMLDFYGRLTDQSYYNSLAKKMYFNIKKMTFKNGLVEATIGARPIGLGAQFYLMMAMLGKSANDDDYRVYLFYGQGDRFFSDKDFPDRLEYHSTIEGSKPNCHDDYAFSDVAEIALTQTNLSNLSLETKIEITNPIRSSRDKYFNIINTGRTLTINNHQYLLGTRGNWASKKY